MSEDINKGRALEAGMVLKDVMVTRNGKTFKQKRWVRASGNVETGKKQKKEVKTKDKKSDAKGESLQISKEHLDDLKKHSEELSKMEPGTEKKVKGTPVKKLGDGSYVVRAHGKSLLVHGASAASMLVDYTHKAGSTSAAFASGDLSGRGIEQDSAISSGAKKVVQKTADKVEKTKAEAKKKQEESRKKAEESKKKSEEDKKGK